MIIIIKLLNNFEQKCIIYMPLKCVYAIFSLLALFFCLLLCMQFYLPCTASFRVLSLVVPGADQPAFRAIRVLRPLKLVSGFEGEKTKMVTWCFVEDETNNVTN